MNSFKPQLRKYKLESLKLLTETQLTDMLDRMTKKKYIRFDPPRQIVIEHQGDQLEFYRRHDKKYFKVIWWDRVDQEMFDRVLQSTGLVLAAYPVDVMQGMKKTGVVLKYDVEGELNLLLISIMILAAFKYAVRKSTR